MSWFFSDIFTGLNKLDAKIDLLVSYNTLQYNSIYILRRLRWSPCLSMSAIKWAD